MCIQSSQLTELGKSFLIKLMQIVGTTDFKHFLHCLPPSPPPKYTLNQSHNFSGYSWLLEQSHSQILKIPFQSKQKPSLFFLFKHLCLPAQGFPEIPRPAIKKKRGAGICPSTPGVPALLSLLWLL